LAYLVLPNDYQLQLLRSSVITTTSIAFIVARKSSQRRGPQSILFRLQYQVQISEHSKESAIIEGSQNFITKEVDYFQKHQRDPLEGHVTFARVIVMAMLIIRQVENQKGSKNSD